ncbi:MAG TPA: hypothetical protein VGY75_08865 [Candidatus Udaeobacter sp.]|jgi:hypothetical protein|nr:hypothetical protein [Candidatus Udaeobacter sp.]
MKGETEPQRDANSHLEQDICIHIIRQRVRGSERYDDADQSNNG